MIHNFEFEEDATNVSRIGGFIIHMPKTITSKLQLMEVYSKRAKLPKYFGKNWDALDEVLRDLSWIEEKRVMIVHEDLPAIGDDMLGIYINLLLNAINDWKDGESHELHVIFPEAVRSKVDSLVKRPRNS